MNRLKIKKISVLAVLILLLLSICGFSADAQRVYDYDDLYTEEEEAELETLLYETSEELKCELAIVTVNDYDGKDSMNYADDFFDEHNIGGEVNDTGFLLLINMSERELYISNAGEAPSYFTDSMIDKMVSEIGSRLAEYDYMDAAEWYVDYVSQNMWEEHHNEDGVMNKWWVQLLVAAVVSVIIVLCLARNNKTKMTVNSRTYLKDNRNNVLESADSYIRTATTSHRIESSSSSSGGSTHTSSSGTTHGGGGGKF